VYIKLDIFLFITATVSVPLMVESFIHPVISVSALIWFIRYFLLL